MDVVAVLSVGIPLVVAISMTEINTSVVTIPVTAILVFALAPATVALLMQMLL